MPVLRLRLEQGRKGSREGKLERMEGKRRDQRRKRR